MVVAVVRHGKAEEVGAGRLCMTPTAMWMPMSQLRLETVDLLTTMV